MIAALLSGLALGFAVTHVYHGLTYQGEGRPTLRDLLSAHGWAARIGRSRWRVANLPVAGVLFVAYTALADVEHGYAVAAGLTFGAVAMRWLDPLAPWETTRCPGCATIDDRSHSPLCPYRPGQQA